MAGFSLAKAILLGGTLATAVVASPPYTPKAAPPPATRQVVKGSCDSINQRKSWTVLTDEEKKAYLDAESCLIQTGSKGIYDGATLLWDELVYVHITQTNIMHGVGAFLPWHRLFVRAHELLLQQECGYTGSQPYWDQASDIERIANDTIAFEDLEIFDSELGFGPNGSGDDLCVQDGPFANMTIHVDNNTTDTEWCLSRDFDESTFVNGSYSFIEECFVRDNFTAAWDCYESGPHAAGHGGVGGTMRDVALSPGDPIFYLHHANLDRLWWEWQQADTSSRLYAIDGPNVPEETQAEGELVLDPEDPAVLEYDGDPGNTTTLNHNLWLHNLLGNSTINSVMEIGNDVICAEYVY